jgi:hypothetical protein
MNSEESPTIEQLVERLPTDRVLARLIHQLLELQAEVEIVRELISEQMTTGLYANEKEVFEKRIRERRMKLLAALNGEWRAAAELAEGEVNG